MGMFDYMKCEIGLPDKEAQDFLFQTKDFECMLDTLVITKDGKLIRESSVPYWDERPPKGIPFHGDFRFYTTKVRTPDGGLHDWSMCADGKIYTRIGEELVEGEDISYEYFVRFNNGIFQKLWRLEDYPNPYDEDY